MGASSPPPECASSSTRRPSSSPQPALQTRPLANLISYLPRTRPPRVNRQQAQDASFRLSYGVPVKCSSLVRKASPTKTHLRQRGPSCPTSSTSPASATSSPPRPNQAHFPSARTPPRRPRSASTPSS